MRLLESAGLKLLQSIDPEIAHGLALRALNSGLLALPGPVSTPRLVTRLAGLTLPNPIGLAAGFDKNATAVGQLSRAGFGYLEVGAATPKPQPGNPKPRLFRLKDDAAAINRFGFNNDGMVEIGLRLSKRKPGIPVGLNLGANKESPDRAADFSKVLANCGGYVDFATVNVSSPNTENLRDLQGKAALAALLETVIEARNRLPRAIPIFLKIAPDLTQSELADIAQVAMAAGLDAIIATNTTLERTGLTDQKRTEAGGLSGRPLFEKSTRILARLASLTQGQMPLVGVGGIASAEDALTKIKAGASAVQLYTAIVYGGMSLVKDIATDLDRLLADEGFSNIADAVGTETEKWL